MAKQVRPTRLDCGCVHSATAWVAMCHKHETEFNESHRQAGLDYQRMMELASGKLQPSGDKVQVQTKPPQSTDDSK